MKKIIILLSFVPLFALSQSTGTGFAINSNGYIATNFHVIEGKEKITIKGINGDHHKSYEARVVKVDKMNDLAILKVDILLGEIPYGFKKSKEDVASKIYAYGYPLPELQGYEIKITEGIINSNSGLKDDPRWYQHTASIQAGNSGGPLFNKYGNLVGINNAGINNEYVKKNYGTETTNVNYAIKSRYLLNLMEDLELSPPINSDISKLETNKQYKEINKFVYFIISSTDGDNSINNNILTNNTYQWYSEMNESIKISQETDKPLMIFFTGSDWCGWCKKLVKEVFNTSAFKDWAKKNVVLVEIDFPRKTKLSDELQKQNKSLQQMFGVRGYPTVWFVQPEKSDDGKVNLTKIGSTGYVAGGPHIWINGAQEILNSK